MKNKIFSIILCTTLFFSMITTPVWAENPENTEIISSYENDSTFSEYLGLLDVLGIDTDYEVSAVVTRGQFVKALYKLMNAEDIRFDNLSFADVAYDVPDLLYAVEYAVAIGAVSDSDKFYPNDPVTYDQAFKMIAEAMGYGAEAMARGGYPYGYTYVVNNIDLTEGLDMSGDFCFGDMCILMGNAVNCRINTINSVLPDNSGYITETFSREETLLEAYHDMIKTEGVVNASNGGFLYENGENIDAERVIVGETSYLVKSGIGCPLGYFVSAYASKKSNGIYEIVLADLGDNEVINVYADNISEVMKNYIVYDDNGIFRKKTFSSDYAVVFNGKAYGLYNWSEFNLSDGYISLIDNNDDGNIDVLSITEPQYLEVRYADTMSNDYSLILYDKHNSSNIYVKDDATVLCDIPLAQFESGSIAEACVSDDGMLISLKKLTDTVSGKVTALGANGEVYIDDTKYLTTSYFKNNYLSLVALGGTVTVALSSDGKLTAFSNVPDGTMTSAYFDNIKIGGGINSSVTVKLFNVSGSVIISDLASKININGSSYSAEEAYKILSPNIGGLILYSANSDGKITKINLESEEPGIYSPSSDGNETLKRYNFPGCDTETEIYYKSFGNFVPHFCISSSTKVFVVAQSESDDAKRFSISGLSFVGNDTKLRSNTIIPYNVTEDGHASLLLYVTSSAKAPALGKTSSSALVAGCTKALDSEGEAVYKITLYSSNKFNDYYISEKEDFIKSMNLTSGQMPFEVGDYIRYSTDNSGKYLSNAIVDFSYKANSLKEVYKDNAELHYYYGKLYSVGKASFGVLLDNGDIVYLSSGEGDVGVVEDGEVNTFPIKRMPTYTRVGDECASILVKCRYSQVSGMVVYN